MDVSTNSQIGKRVMARVRTVHTLRTFVYGPVASALLLVAALWGIGREVWVAKVFENMPSVADVAGVLRFFGGAFIHTDIIVQTLCVATLFAFIWMLRDISRTIFTQMRFA